MDENYAEDKSSEGLAYFARLPGLIQGQVIEHGIPIDSKPAMQKFYQEILNSGPMVSKMDDER